MDQVKGFEFLNADGDFALENAHLTSYLYFPVGNEAGMMGAITPTLNGDVKTSQNTFMMEPVSAEDLHNARSSRNFWVNIEGKGAWSASGVSAPQTASAFAGTEKVRVEAGLLWHKLIRENSALGIKAETTTFAPMTADQIELTKITITNTGSQALKLTPTAAYPVYARSASDIRDHRHVTSLLHRVRTAGLGIEIKPSMSFDERGHKVNQIAYGVYGAEENGQAPLGFFPEVEEFIGEGGTYDWPESVVKNLKPISKANENFEGFEAVGALRFADVTIAPGASKSWIVAMIIKEDGSDTEKAAKSYLTVAQFDKLLSENKAEWQKKLGTIGFGSSDNKFDMWMKWVSLQPILRRIYGCSFLPHHDYGRGGRGWRDLWQDCLALLMMEPADVKGLLYNNYGGVRIDGSNATIIGSKPGEFIADRNNIARSWMDHGSWPLLTTLLYINQTGDLKFLLQGQSYFKDKLIRRSKAADDQWTPEYGNKLKKEDGKLYEGTVLEHILLQNVVQFFNVGAHNNMRLEDADWNDGLDMAYQKGESVAFSSFYASNMLEVAALLRELKKSEKLTDVVVAEEMDILFDTVGKKIDYNKVADKLAVLDAYYGRVKHNVSGKTVKLPVDQVIADLEAKANWIMDHIRKNEVVKNKEGFEWFNGYYDNAGERVEGDFKSGTRMTLTGQVFAIMSGTATDEQVKKVSAAVTKYLKDPKIGGYRLNSNFHEVKLNLGRAFGFAFGHKENGAMFSHMAVMYGNALYKRGFVKEGYDVINSLYNLSCDFEKARIYPGVPEYINEKRRGMYHYLTGSASWLLLTVLTEVYGVKGRLGNLAIEPKLLKQQFDKAGQARVHTLFADKELDVVLVNEKGLDYGAYSVKAISVDGKAVEFAAEGKAAVVNRQVISALGKGLHTVTVTLG